MEEDRLDRIFKQETSATAEEIEAIAGCISRDTVIALHLGGIANVLGSVSGETSACAVGRLEKMDKDALLLASIGLPGNDTVVLGYDEEAMQDLVESTWWSVFLCLNKEEWTALSPETGLNVDDVSIDALRCFLNELGPLGFFEFSAAAEGATPSLELFSAADSCGIDLESLLPKQTRPEPTPTALPQAQPAPTTTPIPQAQPAPTAVPAQPTPAPAPPPTAAPQREPEATPTAAPAATPVTAPTAAPAETVVVETPVTEPTVAPLATAVPAPTASPPTAPVRNGGPVTLAVERDPFDGNFSPFGGQSTEKAQVNSLIFSRLFRRSATGIVPDLAAAWDVRADGRAWTVRLRRALFHDGSRVTARDVLYSIEAMDERFNTLPEYAALAVVDDFTLHIEFKEPFWDFRSRMAWSGSVIVPKGMLEAGVRDFTQLVGSGPFRPVHYERDAFLELERNPDYYETGLPYLDHILINVVPDRGTRSAAFRAGELDYLGFPYSGLPALTLEEARGAPEAAFAPYPIVYALWFDTQSPPFNDHLVRLAVLRAIDPQLIDALVGKGELQSTIPRALFPEWATYFDEQRAVEEWHRSNPEMARRLLAEADHPDGFDTVMLIAEDVPPYWDSVAEAVSAMLEDVGIAVVWERVPSDELLFTPADRNIKFMRVQAFDGDVGAFLREHFAAGGSYNYSRTDIGVPGLDPDRPDSIIPVQTHLVEAVFYIPLPAPLYTRSEWVHGPLTVLDIHDIGWTLKEVWIER